MASSRSAREASLSLPERLSDRLAMARSAFDRRHNAVPPNRRPSARSLVTMSSYDPDMIASRERKVLRVVFREMGDAHRQYRYRTGKGGTPELRAAANAFKDAPSEQLLLPVASMLDELKILAW